MRLLALSLAVVFVAAACVTITPVGPVSTSPTHQPVALIPTVPPPSTPASTPQGTLVPGEAPAGTEQPTGDPTADPTATTKTTPSPEPTAILTANPNDPACSDDAFTLEGFSWDRPYEWSYNPDLTPSEYKSAAVLDVIVRGIDNVLTERNDCGRPDEIAADATYQGETQLTPCTEQGDGTNVIAFGDIPSDLSEDTIAYTCPYSFSETGNIAEADVVIGRNIGWSLDKDSCFFRELLEPTVTHEMGHVLGLGHVSERQHPYLTMSTSSNGTCDNVESTLGLGDMLGLEKLYPAN